MYIKSMYIYNICNWAHVHLCHRECTTVHLQCLLQHRGVWATSLSTPFNIDTEHLNHNCRHTNVDTEDWVLHARKCSFIYLCMCLMCRNCVCAPCVFRRSRMTNLPLPLEYVCLFKSISLSSICYPIYLIFFQFISFSSLHFIWYIF